ncbi:MAG: hypothetical protein JWR19_1834 [Pedosphaera sp.]|nr:hypothetical protein [Pedosphaera sp.]
MFLADIFQLENWPTGYFLASAGLAAFWALENFLVQAALFDLPPITRHPRIYQFMRLSINLVAAGIIVLAFNRPWLTLIAALNFGLSLIVIAYGQYFHRACSLYYAVKNIREGLKVSSFAFHIIPPIAWAGLLSSLVFKIFLIFQIQPQPVSFHGNGLALGFLLLLLFALIMFLQYTSFRFKSMGITSITRAVFAYGYVNSWIAEFFVAPDTRQVVNELAELQKVSPDRLTATEPAWPVGDKVVVLQLESFGWNVVNHHINGREVTPYFNSLVHSSRLFKIQAYHAIGTADMDYAVLSGGTPSPHLISYFVPDIDYTNALPRFMQQHGFRTVALHGATGEFYSRRNNFVRMGFDEIQFREDFRGRPVKHSYWGVRDEELFRISSEKMRNARGPEFHFIITLDTHGPFNLIHEDEKEIFPGSPIWQENYFNSMHALDRNLRDYVESLPTGTTVILYGDHTSGVEYDTFKPAREGDVEYVPCLVHVRRAPESWPAVETTPSSLPSDLRMLDVMNFLRRQVAREQKPASSLVA